MNPHLSAVAVINIILGVLAALLALLLMLALGIASAVTGATAREEVAWLPGFLAGLGFVLVAFVAALAVLHIMAGVLLNRRKRSGKTLGIVTAALSILNFPLGTLFGAYALWVLLNRETEALLVP